MNGKTALMQPPNAGPGGYPTSDEVMGQENAGAAADNNNPVIQAIQTLTAFVVANKEKFGNDEPLQRFQAFVDSLRGGGKGEEGGAPAGLEGMPSEGSAPVPRETGSGMESPAGAAPMEGEMPMPERGKTKSETKKAGPPKGFRREGKPARVLTQ